MDLNDFFREYNRAALAFSGGVDSVYLLYEAVRCGADVTAYYVNGAFQPRFELDDAIKAAAQTGAKLKILSADLLSDPQIVSNPPDRCYYCKKKIFTAILRAAAGDGYFTVLDGTNASDAEGDRPGMQALKEMKVLSPLRLCGIDKEEIRRRSREAGLFTWDKPAYACLATRIPFGEVITDQKLAQTQEAESFLFSLGFKDFRVRMPFGAARIQLRAEDLPLLMQHREEIVRQLKPSYGAVLLDLETRP